MKVHSIHPIILIILDGWGYCRSQKANAIAAATLPTWQHLLRTAPNTTLSCSGPAVGLPYGQMGNSEVGHLHIGAGRLVQQELTRINTAIETGDFFTNPILIQAVTQAQQASSNIHIIGLFSKGGVHSHEQHFYALLQFMHRRQFSRLFIHAFLDGRDTPPKSALASLTALEAYCDQQRCGQIVSIIGRYYAMDRDKHWERTEKAYHLLVTGTACYHVTCAQKGLALAYARLENDEFVQATSIHPPDQPPQTIRHGDIVIFMNFRGDRARQLTQAFIDPQFNAFSRPVCLPLNTFISLCEYDIRYETPAAFPSVPLQNTLSSYISQQGLKQLKLAETEKYAHVTFFLNGREETAYPNEERILIPSPSVATYDLQPAMSAYKLVSKLCDAIASKQYSLIICNFANPDMVGHTGHFQATIQAIEVIDQCLAQIYRTIQAIGGECIITADHGNAEQMFDFTMNQPHTAHTTNPAPFLYIGRPAQITSTTGQLLDIAPTVLYLLGLPLPQEMTGQSLLQLSL